MKTGLMARDRTFMEQKERQVFSPFATHSDTAHATRLIDEPEHPYRTALQRDRDRIVHSRAFRRLKHKRQVFLISFGDHFRTRITHTMEVSQLARTIAKALGLNEELTEAIALGHDLGHTPFGHTGEVVLNRILSGKDTLDGLIDGVFYGGFKHNHQSLRVVDYLEREYAFDGLNLTACVREGIIKHTGLKRSYIKYPGVKTKGLHLELDNATHLEGQVVAISDEIAQRTHDLEDGIIAGYASIDQVRRLPIIECVEEKFTLSSLLKIDSAAFRNALINSLLSTLINDVIETTIKRLNDFYERNKRWEFFDEEIVAFSDEMYPLQDELDKFIHREIIRPCSPQELIRKNEWIIRELFKYYFKHPPQQIKKYEQESIEKWLRSIADYIAGMTDHYAESETKRNGLI